MPSDKLQKLLLLISGTITALGGVAAAVAELSGKVDALSKLPAWIVWSGYAALFVLGIWLLIKWRTRHSRLLRPDVFRLNRNNVEHLVGRADDIEQLRG